VSLGIEDTYAIISLIKMLLRVKMDSLSLSLSLSLCVCVCVCVCVYKKNIIDIVLG
jgi:hypothetical protein